jgi:hypothetical protein
METNCETCKTCGITLKNNNFSTCYKCFAKNNHPCVECKRMTNNKYEKCFNCIAPYKCGDCGGRMLNNKYKICYNCKKGQFVTIVKVQVECIIVMMSGVIVCSVNS